MIGALLQQLTGVPGWLLVAVVGGLVFLEDALFVGFVLPGETAAILAGAMARLGQTSLTAVLVTVVLAAVVGDSVGYEIGRRHGGRVLALPVLDRHRARLERAQSLLARRGGGAVFLARWVAFFRAVMPALAGAAGMRYRTFLAYNALGGLVWGSLVVLAGYAAGASYQALDRVLGPVFAVGVVCVLATALLRAHGTRQRDREREGLASARTEESRAGAGVPVLGRNLRAERTDV